MIIFKRWNNFPKTLLFTRTKNPLNPANLCYACTTRRSAWRTCSRSAVGAPRPSASSRRRWCAPLRWSTRWRPPRTPAPGPRWITARAAAFADPTSSTSTCCRPAMSALRSREKKKRNWALDAGWCGARCDAWCMDRFPPCDASRRRRRVRRTDLHAAAAAAARIRRRFPDA